MRLARAGLCVCLALVLTRTSARADEALTLLNSGSYQVRLSFKSSLFYGPGSAAGSLAGAGNSAFLSPELLAWNPASAAFMDRPLLSISFVPPLKATVTSYVDLGEMSEGTIDDAISDLRSDSTEVSYPSVFMRGGQWGGIHATALAVPAGGVVVGAYMEEPLLFDFALTGTGLEAVMLTEKELAGEETPLGVKMTGDVAASGRIIARASAVSVSTKLAQRFSLGGAVDCYQSRASLTGVASLGGLISFSGQEFVFNDPSSAWEDGLDQNIDARLSARAVGAKIGAAFLVSDWCALDACFHRTPELIMTGAVDFVQHIVPAVSDAGGDMIDPERLDIARMTETKVIHNPTSDTLLVELPSVARFSMGVRRGAWGMVLGYSKYFGEFRLLYMDHVAGVRLNDCFRAGLHLGPTRLGVSLFRLSYFSGITSDISRSDELLLPTASLGFGFDVGPSTGVETQLLGVPGPFFNVTLTHRF